MTSTQSTDTPKRNVLAAFGPLMVLGIAAAGWALSWSNQIEYAVTAMGISSELAWLLPATLDGAPLAFSVFAYQARVQARSVPLRRVFMWATVGLSSYINWAHVPATLNAEKIAALLPVLAALAFEFLMGEAHYRAERALYDGETVPRLTLACWLLDRRRTFHAFRVKTLRPLTAAEDTLGIVRKDTGEGQREGRLPSAEEGSRTPEKDSFSVGQQDSEKDTISAVSRPREGQSGHAEKDSGATLPVEVTDPQWSAEDHAELEAMLADTPAREAEKDSSRTVEKDSPVGQRPTLSEYVELSYKQFPDGTVLPAIRPLASSLGCSKDTARKVLTARREGQ